MHLPYRLGSRTCPPWCHRVEYTPVTSACKYKRMCRQVKDTVTIYSRLALMYRSHDVSKSQFVRCSIAIEIRVLIVILTHASVLE